MRNYRGYGVLLAFIFGIGTGLFLTNGCKRSEKSAPPSGSVEAQDAPPVRDGEYTIAEHSLGALPEGVKEIIVSPDGQHWACEWDDPKNGMRAVTLDGTTVGEYGAVESLRFTSSGKFIYVGGPTNRGGTNPASDTHLFVDTKSGPGYGRIMAGDAAHMQTSHPPSMIHQILVISADGNHIGYSGLRGGAWFVNIDGTEYGPYGSVADIAISSDGRHTAWLTSSARGDQYVLTYDNQKAIPVAGVPHWLRLSPDGTSWLYTSLGKFWTEFPSGTGSPIAEAESTVVRGGADATVYPGANGAGEFTPDAKHVFSHSSGKIILDHKALGPGDNRRFIIRVFLDPDSQQLVCEEQQYVFRYKLDGTLVSGIPRQMTWSFQSPDHRRTINGDMVGQGEKFDLGNGKQLKLTADQNHNNGVFFGPGNKFALLIGRAEPLNGRSGFLSASLVVEDQIGDIFKEIRPSTISFSPAGDHTAYAAVIDGHLQVVIDARVLSPQYDTVANKAFNFDAPQSFRFVAARNQRVLAVTVTHGG